MTSRRFNDTTHTPGPENQTTYIDKPTVRQLKIAFQETPIKLREIEHRWKGHRKQRMTIAEDQVNSRRHQSLSPDSRPRWRPTHTGDPEAVPPPGRSHLPSPPTTPPETRQQYAKSRPTTHAPLPSVLDLPRPTDSPRPILAYPLMPTLQPVKVVSGVYMSIPPSIAQAGYEMKIDMGDVQMTVSSGGRSVSSVLKSGTSEVSPRKDRVILLDDNDKWTGDERAQWKLLTELVENMKRKTPRIRIFNPLATITITCSEVPDIIIQFDLVNEHTTGSDSLDAGIRRSVRLVYSPSRLTLKLWTHHQSTKAPESTFGTKRTVRLKQGGLGEKIKPRSRPGRSMGTVSLASEALGVHDIRDWMDFEIEALERLWKSKEEWGRYMFR